MKCVKVLVVAAGVVGLSTAVCVAETLPYCSVTVIAETFSPDTTGDGAAGILLPKEFPEIPLEWQKPDIPCDKKPFWSDFVFRFRYITDHEMKRFSNHKFGQAFTTLKCECLNYLPWLEKRYCLKAVGGQIIHEKVTDLHKLALNYDAIMNCSGLGSSEVDDCRLEVDKEDSEGILERCCRLEPSPRAAQVMGEWVGLQPEYLHLQGRQVHNYGHGSCGVTLSWGTVLCPILTPSLFEKPPQARLNLLCRSLTLMLLYIDIFACATDEKWHFNLNNR
uniref:Zgc:172341 n=1 Tax=Sinocyclocheilus anshuiensis TaxID=1608454 RepID=A0A671N2X5_9TELE